MQASELKIVVDDLSGPQVRDFLEEHIRHMRSITPLASKHALDLDALRQPGVTFWSVMDGDALVGCGAIKRLDESHAEVKSMRSAPARQRSGIASLLLGHIIAEATRLGFTRLSLETGSTGFFEPARRLYAKFGFEYCGPFADYRSDPHSVFMTKNLSRGSAGTTSLMQEEATYCLRPDVSGSGGPGEVGQEGLTRPDKGLMCCLP